MLYKMLFSTVQWQRKHRVHSEVDAVTARFYSCWNYSATYVVPPYEDGPPPPPLVEEEVPLRNTYMSRREQKSWSWISRRLKPGMTVLTKTSRNLTVRPSQLVVMARRSWDVSAEAEECSLLQAVTRQRVAKIWKSLCVLQLQWSVEWVDVWNGYYRLLLTSYKRSTNSITSPNPVSSY
jgi:hypothetical protein